MPTLLFAVLVPDVGNQHDDRSGGGDHAAEANHERAQEDGQQTRGVACHIGGAQPEHHITQRLTRLGFPHPLPHNVGNGQHRGHAQQDY